VVATTVIGNLLMRANCADPVLAIDRLFSRIVPVLGGPWRRQTSLEGATTALELAAPDPCLRGAGAGLSSVPF